MPVSTLTQGNFRHFPAISCGNFPQIRMYCEKLRSGIVLAHDEIHEFVRNGDRFHNGLPVEQGFDLLVGGSKGD